MIPQDQHEKRSVLVNEIVRFQRRSEVHWQIGPLHGVAKADSADMSIISQTGPPLKLLSEYITC